MTSSKVLFLSGIGWIAGIVLNSFVAFDTRVLLVYLFVGAIIGVCIWKNTAFLASCIILLSCFFGVLYHATFVDQEQRRADAFSPFFEQEVIVEGRVSQEPEERRETARLQISVQGFDGDLLLFVPVGHSFHYGDGIEARGLLEEAPIFEGFNYRAFLWKDGVFGVMRNPAVARISQQEYRNVGEFLYGALLRWKEKVRVNMYQAFSPLESAILGATLLADKSMWTEGFEKRLNETGLTHVTAISGQHVAIFISLFTPVFLWFGMWKHYAYGMTLVLVLLFILLTGGDAAAVRGGFMGTLASLGVIWGRQSQSMRLLVLAGSVMLLFNPFLLARDAGFQLSFLAVSGILFFSSRIEAFLTFLPKEFSIREAAAMTFAAQIFTTPLVLFLFGTVSFVSLITNILIAPVVPLILSLGLLFICFSWIFPVLFVMPLHILLSYFLFVADSFSAIPFEAFASIQ